MADSRGLISFTRLDTGETRSYPGDTSFEPYRREAMRRRTIASQRESVDLTNIPGEGTLATEGTWRREMVEWSMGAGQFSLDRKQEDNPRRFLSSKGVDIFTYPQRATLLPATEELLSESYVNPAGLGLMVRCNDFWVVVTSGSSLTYYDASWEYIGSMGSGDTYGGTAFSEVYSICSNDTYVYIATDTGIWFAQINVDEQFQLYAATDGTTGFTNGYQMVRWVNDQLIASCNARLYAFQPRGGADGAPFGSPPSVIAPGINGATVIYITNVDNVAGVQCDNHGLVTGQQVVISGSNNVQYIESISLSSGEMTVTTQYAHGFSVGQSVWVNLRFNGAPSGRAEIATVDSIPSATTFTYSASKVGSDLIGTGFTSGRAEASGSTAGYGYNNTTFTVVENADTTANLFFIDASLDTYGYAGRGGNIGAPTSQNGTYLPDALVTHENPNWVWSDATGGQTQVYFGGYVQSTSGTRYQGSIYRSDLLGSSTSAADGIQTIASTSAAQPWMLDTPVQCLPMSPDEYPVCVEAYLNYIFIGTNRGIRMCQTLSIYDPTATATGDLKSGALIPNLLQPVTYPVWGIVGDGRFVWFSWADYDSGSTGLGKLDLTTFLPGDDLTPVYASDLMVTTQGLVTCLTWDPIRNVPVFFVSGNGIYGPTATNEGGNLIATEYVSSGIITSSYMDFGIAEPKIPIYFDYGAWLPTDTQVSADVVLDPLAPYTSTIDVPTYTPSDGTLGNKFYIANPSAYPYDRARQFQVEVVLETSNSAVSPVLNRWTLEGWATPVQGTEISAVLAVFSRNTENAGYKIGFDPEIEYNWFESLRYNSILVTYIDGQSSVLAVVDTIDDIPHKAKGDFKAGFEGDFVVDLKTLGPWTFTAAITS